MLWTDQLHRHLIAVTDLVNRADVDARLIAASGIKLDRALFPLLSRIGLHEDLSAIELANLVGRDGSTVSRQIAKLEELGLITRVPSTEDKRVLHLAPSPAGMALLSKVADARRTWIESHFEHWSDEDKLRLVTLLGAMLTFP